MHPVYRMKQYIWETVESFGTISTKTNEEKFPKDLFPNIVLSVQISIWLTTWVRAPFADHVYFGDIVRFRNDVLEAMIGAV